MAGDRRGVRHGVLGAVALIMVGILGTRLWFLQVVDASGIKQVVEAVQTREVDIPPERGRIFDADGRVLADNRRVLTVTVDQEVLRRGKSKRLDLFARLAGPLGTTADSLEERFQNNPDSPVLPFAAATDVDESTAMFLLERVEDYPGVDVRKDWERVYLYAPLASHIIGYMGRIPEDNPKTEINETRQYLDNGYSLNDKVGASGIEQSFEADLRGTPGHAEYSVDAVGNVIQTISYIPPTAGRDVQLTIDLDVQQFAEQALETELRLRRSVSPYTGDDPRQWTDFFRAPAGSVVVEQHGTGQIVAMASYPTFDNRWFNAGVSSKKFAQLFPPEDKDLPFDLRPPSPLVNRAIQGRYNVGSTFKPFTAYAAVHYVMPDGQTFIPNPLTDTFVDTGSYGLDETVCNYELHKCVFRNAWNSVTQSPTTYGEIDLAQAIAVSSDAYFYRIGAEFFTESGSGRALQDELKLFGFGEKSGIELPYEYRGIIPDKEIKARLAEQGAISEDEGKGFFVGDAVQMAIGQGLVAVTPLQLANASATYANGGFLLRPHIVKAVFEPGVHDSAIAGVADVSTGVVHKQYSTEVVRRLDMPLDKVAPIYEGLHNVIAAGCCVNGHAPTGWKVLRNYSIKEQLSGKTGTAQGYKSLSTNDSSVFAAFQSDPAGYTVASYLEKAGYGASASGPLVRCIFQALTGQVEVPKVELGQVEHRVTRRRAVQHAGDTSCSSGDVTSTTGER
ncbi:MAG: penicillin-binding transpeptidase domain-containing protein [Ilumatobacteraceae bacterium]